MPYTPTKAVPNPRKVADNLLAYFATTQTDALEWAAGQDDPPKNIAFFSNNVVNRAEPIFPSIGVADDTSAADVTDGDIFRVAYAVTFEVMVSNAAPQTCINEAAVYAKAIASMIANIPQADLIDDADVETAVLESIELGFDEIRTNEMENDYLQVFQIRAGFIMHGSNQI